MYQYIAKMLKICLGLYWRLVSIVKQLFMP
jgi:hypothetical protein